MHTKPKQFIAQYISIMVLAAALFVPRHARAATIQFVTVPGDTTGNTMTIDALIDPQGQTLNVVQGRLNFQPPTGATLSVQVLNGKSVLTIWPTSPVFSAKNNAIDFTGGVPGGFNKAGLLFEMHVTTSMPGQTGISLSNAAAYLNDGNGTATTLTALPFGVSATQQQSEEEKNIPESTVTTTIPHKSWLNYGIIGILFVIIAYALYAIKKSIKK